MRFLACALRFLLPWACAGCRTPLAGLEDDGFCGFCWLNLPRIHGLVCLRCGIPLKDGGNLCFPCRESSIPFAIRASGTYEGALSKSIYRFKYRGRKSLAKVFAVLMQQTWETQTALHSAQALVPVPLYPRQERLRGYNQAALLAAELGPRIHRAVLPLLLRTRKTASQTSLNKERRRINVTGAFALDPAFSGARQRLKGLSVILIDDVCTTTSTLAECARALRAAGIRTTGALVLARDL